MFWEHKDNKKILIAIHTKERSHGVTGVAEQCLQSLPLQMLLFKREREGKSIVDDLRLVLDDTPKVMLITLWILQQCDF